jgi:hypothetical protein
MIRRYRMPICGNGVSQEDLTDEATGGYRPRYIWELWGVYRRVLALTDTHFTIETDVSDADHAWLAAKPDVEVLA